MGKSFFKFKRITTLYVSTFSRFAKEGISTFEAGFVCAGRQPRGPLMCVVLLPTAKGYTLVVASGCGLWLWLWLLVGHPASRIWGFDRTMRRRPKIGGAHFGLGVTSA
jgi:hypothetical protein